MVKHAITVRYLFVFAPPTCEEKGEKPIYLSETGMLFKLIVTKYGVQKAEKKNHYFGRFATVSNGTRPTNPAETN